MILYLQSVNQSISKKQLTPEEKEFSNLFRKKYPWGLGKYYFWTIIILMVFLALIYKSINDEINIFIQLVILSLVLCYLVWSLFRLTSLFHLERINNNFSVKTKRKIIVEIMSGLNFTDNHNSEFTSNSELNAIEYKKESELEYSVNEKYAFIYINDYSVFITCFSYNTWWWGIYPGLSDQKIKNTIIDRFRSEIKNIHNSNTANK